MFSEEQRNACPYIQDARCLKVNGNSHQCERLYISFKSLVNDFVYSFGRAALLLLVEVQNHTVPVRERRRIRVNCHPFSFYVACFDQPLAFLLCSVQTQNCLPTVNETNTSHCFGATLFTQCRSRNTVGNTVHKHETKVSHTCSDNLPTPAPPPQIRVSKSANKRRRSCKQNQLGAQIFVIFLLLFSTCFGQICAHYQEKIPYLCDTWYQSLYIDDCLVFRVE